jgi:hypothetical protein
VNLKGVDMFRICEQPGAIYVTDRVRDFVLEREYTNVIFREVGETF